MSMTFEDLLARDGYLVYRTRGTSMEPMLRQDRDLITAKVPTGRLKKYDVALYKRGSAYVLHRVVGVKPDHYLIRGDNTYAIERVPDGAVIGVLSAFLRKGKNHDVNERGYRAYARVWNAIYPLRRLVMYGRSAAVRLARRLGVLPLIKRALGRS
jgi:signal peptidase I